MSLTTKDYWDRNYRPERSGGGRPVIDRRRDYFADEFLRLLEPRLPARPGRLLEMGCGNSQWLPHFALRGWQVAGLDYSEDGCRMAERNLAAVGCAGKIALRDFTRMGAEFDGAFDLLISFGVVEHFERTAEAVGWFERCLAPGGLMATVVPNLSGAMGRVMRWVDLDIYRAHVPVGLPALTEAHRANGLEILDATPLGFLGLGMVNVSSTRHPRFWGRAAFAVDWAHLLWRRRTSWRPQSASASSYLAVVARRPEGTR